MVRQSSSSPWPEAGAGWVLVLGSIIAPASSLYDAERKLESARLYGNIDEYAYYFVDLLVGTPPQRVSVILDTGSGLCAFPCSSCPHCGKHIDPLFDFKQSTTARWISCGSECQQRKSACTWGHCSYRQNYLEGSSISGYWFEDLVRLGDAIQRNPPVKARMGCHQNENRLFYQQKANGILGIQGSTTLLRNLFEDREHVNSNIFSICLAEQGGRLTVGGHNESTHKGSIEYIQQLGSGYYVTLSSMTINGREITGFRTTMIDSGTTYTYFNSRHYTALREGIEKYCGSNGCGATRQNVCYRVQEKHANLTLFPVVEMYFGKVKTLWNPREYLYRKRGSTNYWCYSFQNDGSRTTTTLGASWMLYKEIIFDLQEKRVGIVPAECPEYRKRPEHHVDPAALEVPSALAGTAPDRAPASTEPVKAPTPVHKAISVPSRSRQKDSHKDGLGQYAAGQGGFTIPAVLSAILASVLCIGWRCKSRGCLGPSKVASSRPVGREESDEDTPCIDAEVVGKRGDEVAPAG